MHRCLMKIELTGERQDDVVSRWATGEDGSSRYNQDRIEKKNSSDAHTWGVVMGV